MFVLFLNGDGSVARHVRITEGSPGFQGAAPEHFGGSLAVLQSGGESTDTFLVIGALGDFDHGPSQPNGIAYILKLDQDANVRSYQTVSAKGNTWTLTKR